MEAQLSNPARAAKRFNVNPTMVRNWVKAATLNIDGSVKITEKLRTGRPALFTEDMDIELEGEIIDLRSKAICIACVDLQEMARRIYNKQSAAGAPAFNASDGWIFTWMRVHNFSMRGKTSTGHSLPPNWSELVDQAAL